MPKNGEEMCSMQNGIEMNMLKERSPSSFLSYLIID